MYFSKLLNKIKLFFSNTNPDHKAKPKFYDENDIYDEPCWNQEEAEFFVGGEPRDINETEHAKMYAHHELDGNQYWPDMNHHRQYKEFSAEGPLTSHELFEIYREKIIEQAKM